MTSSQPTALGQYLARHGFASNPGNPTWLDRDTGQHIIRVVSEACEQTELICLTPHSACRYMAAFCPGTPDAVIIAAAEAALSPAPAPADRAGAGRRRASGARSGMVTGDDDR